MNRRFVLTPIASAALALGTTLSMAQTTTSDGMPRSAPPTNIDVPAGAQNRAYGSDVQERRMNPAGTDARNAKGSGGLPRATTGNSAYGTDVQKERMAPARSATRDPSGANPQDRASTGTPPYGTDVQKDRMAGASRTGSAMHDQNTRASRTIGMDVVNRQGDTVGKVEDIVLDRNGNVYAIVSTGTFLAVGERLHAVPWPALESDASAGNFILDVDKARLSRAPGFKANEYPNMNDPNWTAENRRHFPADRTSSASAGSGDRTTGMDQGAQGTDIPKPRGALKGAYGSDVQQRRMTPGGTDAQGSAGRNETPTSTGTSPYGSDVQKERMAPGRSDARDSTGPTGQERASTGKPPYGTDVQPERMKPGSSN